MSQRMIRFLLLLITVGCLVAFLFYFNPHLVTVHYGPGTAKTWEAPLALVLLVVFFFGALSIGVLAVLLGLQHSFDLWLKPASLLVYGEIMAELKELMNATREHLFIFWFGFKQNRNDLGVGDPPALADERPDLRLAFPQVAPTLLKNKRLGSPVPPGAPRL